MAAMNSYIRQPPITADQIHSFLKDKQAWENAISMYQGPDPLDHWYNYVCWYENQGDPESRYRETLERCLTLFEHSEYYKQDQRLVRLWIKYIDMQPNPLHFYQVLHQRGVGRQVAAFYISWAGYYESVNAFKEAESVYNLGFQEKAQSYAELHHAHNKLMYTQSLTTQALYPNKQAQLQQQQQQQQQHHIQPMQSYQQQVQQHQQHHQQQQLSHLEMQGPPPQLQNYRENISFQQNAAATLQRPEHYQQQQQHNNYQEHSVQFNEQHQQSTRNPFPPRQLEREATMPNNYMPHCNEGRVASAQANFPNEQQQHQQMTDTTASNATLTQTHAIECQLNNEEKENTTKIDGIRLPRRFSTTCLNNHETWRPALFLEEPADPSRQCHYPKSLVYPGNDTEFSPEELRARLHLTRQQPVSKPTTQVAYYASDESAESQQLQEIGTVQYENQQNENEKSQQAQDQYSYATAEHKPCSDGSDENDDNGQTPTSVINEKLAQVRQQTKPLQQAVSEIVNTVDDLEDQIEASTIRFSAHAADQNNLSKTIKIKFKKDRKQGNDTHNGSSYSAYTIESIYQQEIASPSPVAQELSARRNGHTFHPYVLGQTSTPKISSKRIRTKVKRVNKCHVIACSSSNSSSDAVVNGPNTDAADIQGCDNAIHNATFNDNANYSFSSAVALENSNCSLTSAVGRLNFRDATVAANSSVAGDFSTYQENSYFATQNDVEAKERRLEKALETIERHMAKEAIDPFNSELCRAFLTKLNFPGVNDAHANYKIIQTPLPKISNTRSLCLLEGVHFAVDKEVGRGSYGSVYKATDVNTSSVVALKFQKPPNTWEIYICDQVLKRIQSPNILPGLMDISVAIIAPNASLIATEFSPFGSLLDINNKIRQATTKVMHESLVMHFSSQICNIIHYLHQNKIIHADIKPDNFLLMRIPSTDLHFPSLRLIDFGCAIDMTLFPEKTKFRKVIQTDGFTCIEMQEGRPWSYETDLFCIAGTVHVMLLGEYMQVQKRGSSWDIKQKLPRYLKKHIWTKFFTDMLNIKTQNMPNLYEQRNIFEEESAKMDSELQSQIRTLSNILYRR